MNVALGTLDHSRLGVAAQAVGIAQGATDHAVAYANERRQFGQAISEFQGIQFKLADMETRTAAARELLYRACAKIDRHEPDAGKYSAMAKLFASDTAMCGDRRGRPGARRLRLRQRVPGRALHARRQDHADLRGHERDPACRDRAVASGSLGLMLSRWPTGRRIAFTTVLCLAVALTVAVLLQGLSPLRLAARARGARDRRHRARAVAALVIGLIVAKLANYQDPEDEAEFERLVIRSEELARENLAAEPDEGEFLELDPYNPRRLRHARARGARRPARTC